VGTGGDAKAGSPATARRVTISPIMAAIGGIELVPGSRASGATGQVLSIRAVPQQGRASQQEGRQQAEVTYRLLPEGNQSTQSPSGASLSARLLAQQTITVLQELDPTAIPGAQSTEQAAPAIAINGASAGGPPENERTAATVNGAQGNAAQTGNNSTNADEQQALDTLGARDAAVRSEEESHQALAGAYAGPIHYDYQMGPDGALYAVAGHVGLSTAGAGPQQMASALGALLSASSMAGATSMEDRLSAAAAGRSLAELEANQHSARSQAIASYGKSANMG
jgi:hypothetical protein